jgi:hypothetical protein
MKTVLFFITVAKKLLTEMDNKFGNAWICFTGINSNFTEPTLILKKILLFGSHLKKTIHCF